MCFEVQAQKSFFQYPPFLAPPSPANRVKAKTQKYFWKYLYLIFRKSQEVSNQYLYRFRSSIICKKRLGAKRPPPTKDRVKVNKKGTNKCLKILQTLGLVPFFMHFNELETLWKILTPPAPNYELFPSEIFSKWNFSQVKHGKSFTMFNIYGTLK